MQSEQKGKGIIWNRSRYFAVGLLIFLLVLTIFLFFSMHNWSIENSKLQQPRTFHIPFGANYGVNAMNGSSTPYDFQIDLTITYPQNTLMVGDIVNFQALAVVHNQPLDFRIDRIIIGFENSEKVPFHQTNNITDSLSMNLLPYNDNLYTATGKCLWQTEGTYHMALNLIGSNSSGTLFFPTVFCQNMAITVYPRTEMAQIVTNSATMTLTYALYALTVIGTFSLFLMLWDRNPSAQKGDDDSTQSNPNPDKHNDKSKQKIEEGKSNSKKTKKQANGNKR